MSNKGGTFVFVLGDTKQDAFGIFNSKCFYCNHGILLTPEKTFSLHLLCIWILSILQNKYMSFVYSIILPNCILIYYVKLYNCK